MVQAAPNARRYYGGMYPLGRIWTTQTALAATYEDMPEQPLDQIEFGSVHAANISGRAVTFTPHAAGQMCTRLGVPYAFAAQCSPRIQQQIMAEFLEDEKKERDTLFFRLQAVNTNFPQVRAVFTSRYTPLDNCEVIKRLRSLGYDDDTPVKPRIDGGMMSLTLMDMNGRTTLKKVGDVAPGVYVQNSEIGLSSLSLGMMVVKLICTNGAIMGLAKERQAYRHISRRVFDEGLFDQLVEKVRTRDYLPEFRSMEIAATKYLPSGTNLEDLAEDVTIDEIAAIREGWVVETGVLFPEPPTSDALPLYTTSEYTYDNLIQSLTRAANDTTLSAVSANKLNRLAGQLLETVGQAA